MLLYLTTFCPLMMDITQHSVKIEESSFDEADLVYGDPEVTRPPYRIYPGGVLVSTFPWSLPPREELSEQDEFELFFG